MASTPTRLFKSTVVATAIGVGLSSAYRPAQAASFNSGLVQCSTVTIPAAPPGCAASPDKLGHGGVSINNVGDLSVSVAGAPTNKAYNVAFVLADASSNSGLGSFMTDNHGNGHLRKQGAFPFGKAGAGYVIVTDNGGTQFISGLAASTSGLASGPDFEPGLVKCADVSIPGAIKTCGTDPLSGGFVEVESDSGDVTIKISGAAPNTTYSATLVGANGVTATSIGNPSSTDKHGTAVIVKQGAFAGAVIAGTVVLQNAGTPEFLSGFKVNQHPASPTVSQGSFVRCVELTDPLGSNCGTDPLDGGRYNVQANGKLSVELIGAAPSTNYEVFFRPLNGLNTSDEDTALLLPTDKNGNVHANTVVFKSSTTASGNFVVKQKGTNMQQSASEPYQFVAGFVVR
jgi:hypothetical protein